MMKKILAGLTVVVTMLSTSAVVMADSVSPQYAFRADGQNSVNVESGESTEVKYLVVNHDSERTIEVNFAARKGEATSIEKSWVSFSEKTMILAPGEQKYITAQISVPSTASAGTYNGTVVGALTSYSAKYSQSDAVNSTVGVRIAMGERLEVNVTSSNASVEADADFMRAIYAMIGLV